MFYMSQDLETTCSPVEYEGGVDVRRHTTTPKPSQVHNRTLPGNLTDQSLGLLSDSVLIENMTTDLVVQSEVCIADEVSITQEESESGSLQCAGDIEQASSRMGEGVGDPDLDDTPGIGMEVVEVVCEAELEQDNENEQLEGELKQDDENELCLEIDQLIQGTCYELRFPKRQHSNLIRKKPMTPLSDLLPSLSVNTDPMSVMADPDASLGSLNSVTPRTRKRGRPRVSLCDVFIPYCLPSHVIPVEVSSWKNNVLITWLFYFECPNLACFRACTLTLGQVKGVTQPAGMINDSSNFW